MSDEKKSRFAFSKVFCITGWICCFLFVSYGLFYKLTTDVELINLENEVKHLRKLKEKEIRIDNMTKTLLIHYNHLSKFEAYYYSIIIDDFVEEYGIPWEIYPALIRIESNFATGLRSKKHAKGIAQVLETTAESIANELNIEYESSKTVWNDLLNLIIGWKYLSDNILQLQQNDSTCLKINDDCLGKGLKIYNGGPGFKKGHKAIGQYRTTVWEEYQRLIYIGKGVVKENQKESIKKYGFWFKTPDMKNN